MISIVHSFIIWLDIPPFWLDTPPFWWAYTSLVQSQTEGEPTAQPPPHKSCVSWRALWQSRVMSYVCLYLLMFIYWIHGVSSYPHSLSTHATSCESPYLALQQTAQLDGRLFGQASTCDSGWFKNREFFRTGKPHMLTTSPDLDWA